MAIKKCPYNAEEIEENAILCKHCVWDFYHKNWSIE